LSKKPRCLGHVTYFSNFGPRNISVMADYTNLKCCMRIDGKGY